jgi:signal transduction histidine kinase
MLANVVDNACKFARSRVRLDVAASGPRKLVGITVEDDGPGLPPEAWDVVLEIGAQWQNSNGSGLGLAIVRDLTHLYGGYLQFNQSELGGLKVTIELPKYDSPATPSSSRVPFPNSQAF